MWMIAKPKGRREKKIKNYPESSKNYLPVSLRKAWGFTCIELACKVESTHLIKQYRHLLSTFIWFDPLSHHIDVMTSGQNWLTNFLWLIGFRVLSNPSWAIMGGGYCKSDTTFANTLQLGEN